ncbi:MAG: hypothetical protein ACTSQF_13595 [Candidatus Heimdallarchaeaceae archaeon]
MDIFTWLYEHVLKKTEFIHLFHNLTETVHQSHFTFIFIHTYFEKNQDFIFKVNAFEEVWNTHVYLLTIDKLTSFIRVPLCNFYLLSKKLSKDNIDCRIVNLDQDEYYYYLIQYLGEQSIIDSSFTAKMAGFNSKMGLISSHFIDFNYNYSFEEMNECEREIAVGMIDFREGKQPIPLPDGSEYSFSKDKLDELRSIPNECIHEFVDLARQIDVCIEMGLKIYKQGDVRVFGINRGGTFNDKTPKRALFSLEKKDFNKLQTPYVMNEEEFFDFMEFWKDFYGHVFDTEDFNDVIFLLYDTQNQPFDSIFFNYFKALEILFASDFTMPREKSEAFSRRVKKFLNMNIYPEYYWRVIEALKGIRNEKAHEGYVGQEKIDVLGKVMRKGVGFDTLQIYYETKEIIRVILKDYWSLITQNNYSEDKTRKSLDT